MNDQTNDRCSCTNCPGELCQCGCQTGMSAVPMAALPPHCACGPACGCAAAEQGCVCG